MAKLQLFLCFTILIFFSFPAAAQKSSSPAGEEGQILTMILQVTQADPDEPEKFTVLRTTVGPGRLKKMDPADPYNPATLLLRFTDDQGRVLETIRTGHPMQVRYEYVDEEGSLQTLSRLERQKVWSVRTAYHPSLAFLEIENTSEARSGSLQVIPISIR